MALKFQYNKTELQGLTKQLKVRYSALPLVKHKEAALRIEVKKATNQSKKLQQKLDVLLKEVEDMTALWCEFDFSILSVKNIVWHTRNIAGVKTPELDSIDFNQKPIGFYHYPSWYADGMEVLKRIAYLAVEREFHLVRAEMLDAKRKKTTQKVNLFEKVQIPDFREAISKIKRFLEDQETLEKTGQKIMKKKNLSEAS